MTIEERFQRRRDLVMPYRAWWHAKGLGYIMSIYGYSTRTR